MTNTYTLEELINCVYYESALELLSGLKLIVGNGIEANGHIKALHENMLPRLTGERLELGPLNRMMVRDLYDKVYWRVTAEPEEERVAFIKEQAEEFQKNVIDEVQDSRIEVLDSFKVNYPEFLQHKNYNQDELIKCVYYLCVVDHLKEMIRKVEQYISEDKTLEDFDRALPKVTEEYVKLNKTNREMIANLNQQMWQWFGSVNEEEFTDFIKTQADDFDICIDVRPVGEYHNGEVVLYDDNKKISKQQEKPNL